MNSRIVISLILAMLSQPVLAESADRDKPM